MANKLIYTLLLIVAINVIGYSQNRSRTIDIGGFVGMNTVIGDITTPKYPQSFRPSFGALVRVVPNDRIAYRGMFGYEKLYGFGQTEMENVFETNQYTFSKSMVSGTGLIEFNWKDYRVRKKKMRFSPFLGIGLEFNYFFDDGHDFIEEDGTKLDGLIENPNFTPPSGSLGGALGTGSEAVSGSKYIDQEESEFTVSIPIVFGVKYNLGNWWSMSAEVYAKKFFTDKIDNLDDPYRYFDDNEQFKGTSSSHNNDWIFGGRICIYYQVYHGCRACPDFK